MSGAPLAGQVALVTGASTGIGRVLAGELAGRGAEVAGLARGASRLGAAMGEVEQASGRRTLAVAADVTDQAAVDDAVAHVLAAMRRIDLVVNCAGLVDAQEVPLWEADPDQWWSVVTSHVRGAQLIARAVLPGMLERGSGRLVNLASSMGTKPDAEYSAYSVAKAAQMRLTESLAASLGGTGVSVFNIAPGLVETDMTRSMPRWDGQTDWTPPERVVELVCAAALGDLDAWSGRFLRAGVDSPQSVRSVSLDGPARQLRLRPYGPQDPFA